MIATQVAEWIDAFGADGCSDLHLTQHRGLMKVKWKETLDVPEFASIRESDIDEFAASLFSGRTGGWDANTFQGIASFDGARNFRARATVKRTLSGTAATIRLINRRIPTTQEMGVPAYVANAFGLPSGFVVVAGPTGSGKNTTIAASLNNLISKIPSHILTLEDPIEFEYTGGKSLVTQREIGTHVASFEDGIIDAKGSHPRVIVIGEIREDNVARAALELALSGHLVVATIHAGSVEETILRLLASFPADMQHQARAQLSQALRAVVVQSLVRKDGPAVDPDENQLALVHEYAFMNRQLANTIRGDGRGGGELHHIRSHIRAEGRRNGMVPMEDSLAQHVRAGKLTRETAAALLPYPEDLDEALRHAPKEA